MNAGGHRDAEAQLAGYSPLTPAPSLTSGKKSAMPIIPCNDELMKQAESLIRSVFPSMSLLERLSFIIIKNPKSITARPFIFLAGIKSKLAFDVYVDEFGRVVGTTGLYQYKKDAAEAVWVAWFCVDPSARGKGIGQQLIEHTIRLAIKEGFELVRLYTSTDPNEDSAQRLYERNGFKEVRREKGLFVTKIFRELKIVKDPFSFEP